MPMAHIFLLTRWVVGVGEKKGGNLLAVPSNMLILGSQRAKVERKGSLVTPTTQRHAENVVSGPLADVYEDAMENEN